LIKNIGYEISEKKLPIQIYMPECFLPGTDAKVTFILGVEEMGLYVPEETLYQDGDDYYANVGNEEESRRVKVMVGQRFSIEEGGNEFKYVEILSGIKEGDVLIVETVDDLGSTIRENINNE